MNDYSLHDPQLKSIEARLAAMTPKPSLLEQQQLLYQCGFAAGKSAAGRTVRRWRAAAAALVVLLLGVSVPLARGHLTVATPRAEPLVPAETAPQRMLAQVETPSGARLASVELDAWQVQPSDSASFAQELAHFQENDPRLRSLAVGALTRAVLEP